MSGLRPACSGPPPRAGVSESKEPKKALKKAEFRELRKNALRGRVNALRPRKSAYLGRAVSFAHLKFATNIS